MSTRFILVTVLPTILAFSEYIILIIIYLTCSLSLLYANMPTEVRPFLIITRVYVWFNMFKLFESNVKCKKSQEGWEYMQHSNPVTAHRASTHTSTNMPVTPRAICTVTLPATAGQPAPIICAAVAHTWAPCPFLSHSAAALRQNRSHRLGPRSPPPLPLHSNRSYRKASPPLTQGKEATNVSSHNTPLSLPT